MAIIFRGATNIHIQGSQVLKLAQLNQNQVEFDVITLDDPGVKIIDTRLQVIEVMQKIIQTDNVDLLFPIFNTPANMTVTRENDEQLLVFLEDHKSGILPKYMLWIAVGVDSDFKIPYFDYVYVDVYEFQDKTVSMFMLYERPPKENKNESIVSISGENHQGLIKPNINTMNAYQDISIRS